MEGQRLAQLVVLSWMLIFIAFLVVLMKTNGVTEVWCDNTLWEASRQDGAQGGDKQQVCKTPNGDPVLVIDLD